MTAGLGRWVAICGAKPDARRCQAHGRQPPVPHPETWQQEPAPAEFFADCSGEALHDDDKGDSHEWAGASFWSLWHVSSFFFPGMPQQLVPPLLFLLPVAFTGVFLGLVFMAGRDSVLAAMVGHLSVNITMALRGADGSSVVFWWTLCVVYGAVALAGTVRFGSQTPAIR